MTRPPAGGPGRQRLRRALGRAGRALRPLQPQAAALAGSLPLSAWEQQAEQRLRAIEQKLASQNRLLLITIVTIVGETIYKVSLK